jgi:hypothetical protein
MGFQGRSQAVEWVVPLQGQNSITYVNDSLIYAASFHNNFFGVSLLAITQLNSLGKIVNSNSVNLSFPYTYTNQLNVQPQQKYILPNNKVLYANSNFIIDSNLNVETISGFVQRNIFEVINTYSDFSQIRIDVSNDINFNFYRLNGLGVIIDSNYINSDLCFYGQIGVVPNFPNYNYYNNNFFYGNPFFDSGKTLYFSRTSFYSNSCSLPSNYIGANTISGNIVNYSSKWDALQQSIITLDTNNNLKLLPFYGTNSVAGFVSPEYFQEDSNGNILVLSSDGYLGKYSKNPWTPLWIKAVNNTPSGVFHVDKNDQIYVTTDSSANGSIGGILSVLNTNGKLIYKKWFPNVPLTDVQSDNNQSIYVTSNDSSYFNYGAPKIVLDCFTISGNFVAKFYTGTIPSTPKLSLTGIVLKSNFPRGILWYRNDTLLPTETDTTTLALRDGTYTFKSFCKWDTLTFHGVNAKSNGNLKVVDIPGGTYQWYLNGILIPNANTDSIIPTSSGKYTVTVTFTGLQAEFSSARVQSGTTYTATYSFNVSQAVTGLTDNSSYVYFALFPNPASGKVTVKIAGNSNGQQLLAYNSLGQEVINQQLFSDQMDIDISKLHKGVYTAKVGSQIQKLVIE